MKRNSRKSGFTLLEILVSTSVIMIGIFGIAGAIALSEQLVKRAMKADMAANCGRAALETMLTQNWLEDFNTGGSVGTRTYNYNWNPGFGTTLSKGKYVGSASMTEKLRSEDFSCADHLRQNNAGRDLEQFPPKYDTTLKSDYSWVGTIRKIADCDYCEVSAAVTYKRYRNDAGSNAVLSLSVSGFSNNYDTINVTASASSETAEEFKAGEYVYLTTGSYGHWYRIDNVFATDSTLSMQLRGAFWDGPTSGCSIYTPGGVVAVYSQIVPTDNRLSWTDQTISN